MSGENGVKGAFERMHGEKGRAFSSLLSHAKCAFRLFPRHIDDTILVPYLRKKGLNFFETSD